MITLRRWIAPLILALAAACDDEPESKPRPGFDNDSGIGDAGPDSGGDTTPERTGPQYAVVSGDFTATSISLLDVNAEVVADDYLNSGSTETGLVTALSGDVELPTRSGERGVLVLIDRFKTDVITRVQLSDGKILGQVKTHTPAEQDSENAFSSNPQDYVRIDEHTAWVTRNQPNIDPAAEEIDLGDDLLRIDPSTMERTDERIDLSALRGKATRKDPLTGNEEEVELYAHPSRLTRVGETLIVGLGHAAYDFSSVGVGVVAVIDLASRAVTGLELEGLKGCTQVSPIPASTDRVLVACTGDYSAPGESEGVAIVRVVDGNASVEKTWRVADHPNAPAVSGSFQALDANTITAATNEFSGANDSVFGTLDLESGELTQLLSIPAGKGTFGTPLYDAATKKLLVPDATVDDDMRPTAGVHVLTRNADGFDDGELTKVAEDTGLAVRGVYPL